MPWFDEDGNILRGDGEIGKVGGSRPLYAGILAGALGPAGACGSSPTTATVNKLGRNADGYTLTFSGLPTGGTQTLNVGTQTVAIPYNQTASGLQTQLRALPNVQAASCYVASGSGPLPVSPLCLRIVFNVAETNRTVSIGTNSLTGGSSPSATLQSNWGYTGHDDPVTNRTQSIDAVSGTFILYEKVDREFRPVWVDC